MENVSVFYLSCAGSHIAYEFPAVGHPVVVSAARSIQSYSIEFCCHKQPLPGWVVCTKAEFEAIKAQALAALGLVSISIQDALFLEMCDAFDAQEATRFAA